MLVAIQDRFVEVIAQITVGQGSRTRTEWQVASGFLIDGRHVLTSLHAVANGDIEVRRAIPWPDGPKRSWRARVLLRGDVEHADLAVLELTADAPAEIGLLPLIAFARVADRTERLEVVEDCGAVGFPRFLERGQGAAVVRQAAQVSGRIPVSQRPGPGLLTLQTGHRPEGPPLPSAGTTLAGSAWSGMSGAAVLAGDCVIGVVSEHAPRQGASDLTIVPITLIDTLPDRDAWWTLLGTSFGRLRTLPAAWNRMLAWLAGIVSAVLIAAIGVVFTGWFNARGADTIDRLSGTGPLTIGYVAIDHAGRDTALRKAVTDPDRAVLLGTPGNALAALLARYQEAPIGSVDVVVVLVGRVSSVRIVNMRPRILKRLPVSRGALLTIPREGEVPTVEISADLDRPDPRFTPKNKPDTSYFRETQIDLKRDERVTFSMTFRGKKAFYEFELVLTVLTGNHTEDLVVRAPDGGPFRLTGESSAHDKSPAYDSTYEKSPLGGWRVVHHDICEGPAALEC
ncbi:trypsin-like peptidase domain-containing protein [Nonomuraea jabiensis]|uniref:trypsin-like peptidase domain-containing protein n=1 Tax=Nonomuraea jabiensis TaxID=882448 RepID=UPI00367AF53D